MIFPTVQAPATTGSGGIFQDILGGLGQIGSAVTPALPAIAGTLLTGEAYDRLSDVGREAQREALALAERGQAESQFRPFTVTTPTGAMFSARLGGQPMVRPMAVQGGRDFLPTRSAVTPIDPPSMMLPLGAPPRPEMPMMQTADMVQFTDPVTGNQMSGSSTLQQYRRQLKNYYDSTPGAQQYYEGLERQEQRQRFSDLFGTPQPERLPTQPVSQPSIMLPPSTTGGLEVGMTLSPQEQALQRQLFGGAGDFFGQAQTPTATREQQIFDRMRAAQRPDEERQRLALEERLLSQGRLGTSSATYGGGTPEQLALATAQEEARNRAMLTAMQQAQAEQAQQAALGQQLLGASFLPQAQLLAATQPALRTGELQQQAQLFGTGLFGETAMSGLESRLLAEQARANLLGGIGSNILAGLMTPQVTSSGQVVSPGGMGDLGGLFGGVTEGLGNIIRGIGGLFD